MEKNEQPVQSMEPMFHQLIVMSPPTVLGGKTNIQVVDPGITLRDHFAGLVLTGLDSRNITDETRQVLIARVCYEVADRMMQERERWKGGKRV